MAGLVFVQRIARLAGLAEGWAWLVAAIVGLSPVYLFHGLQPMSDVPALARVTAAIHLAWTSDGKPRRAMLAGVATAVAVLIRPTNVFCAIPIAIGLWGRWRCLALWIAGGIPGALWQAWLNHTSYGGALSNGYGPLRTMVGLEYLAPTLRAYAMWLPVLFTPAIWLAPVTPFLRAVPLRTRLILATWAAMFPLFYAFYWCTWDHGCGMRFVLPAAPALVILGLLAPQHFLARRGVRLFSGSASRRRLAVSVVLAVALPGSHVADGVGKRLLFRIHANRKHAVVSSRVRDHVPADSILLANRATGSLRHYTDLACIGAEFTRARPVSDELVARIAGSGRPVFVVVHDNETTVPMGSGPATAWWGFAGTWGKRASLWDGGVGVWQWMPPPGWSRDAEPR